MKKINYRVYIPPEVWFKIFVFLPHRDLLGVQFACKLFYNIITNNVMTYKIKHMALRYKLLVQSTILFSENEKDVSRRKDIIEDYNKIHGKGGKHRMKKCVCDFLDSLRIWSCGRYGISSVYRRMCAGCGELVSCCDSTHHTLDPLQTVNKEEIRNKYKKETCIKCNKSFCEPMEAIETGDTRGGYCGNICPSGCTICEKCNWDRSNDKFKEYCQCPIHGLEYRNNTRVVRVADDDDL